MRNICEKNKNIMCRKQNRWCDLIWTILDNFRECSQAFRSIIAAVHSFTLYKSKRRLLWDIVTPSIGWCTCRIVGKRYVCAIIRCRNGMALTEVTCTFMVIFTIRGIKHGNIWIRERTLIMWAACYMDTDRYAWMRLWRRTGLCDCLRRLWALCKRRMFEEYSAQKGSSML